MSWMNLELVIQSEVSQREKQILYVNAHIWNLEKWCWWTSLQGKNGDSDAENSFVDTAGEGESGTNGESSIDIYTLSCVKYTASDKLLHKTGSPPADDLWWPGERAWGGGRGREAQEGRDTCMVDSHCYSAEANTTLCNFPSIKNKF